MDGPRAPQPEDDPPPSAEVDLEETVELDDALELEDWDAREKERDGKLTLASVWVKLLAALKQPSVGLIIAIAYHLVAIGVYCPPLPPVFFLHMLTLN